MLDSLRANALVAQNLSVLRAYGSRSLYPQALEMFLLVYQKPIFTGPVA
jgi:hypothetical protein